MFKKVMIVGLILFIGTIGLVFIKNTDKQEANIDLMCKNAYAATCSLKGEKISGMNMICHYDCPSGTVAITIDASKLCPLTIDR